MSASTIRPAGSTNGALSQVVSHRRNHTSVVSYEYTDGLQYKFLWLSPCSRTAKISSHLQLHWHTENLDMVSLQPGTPSKLLQPSLTPFMDSDIHFHDQTTTSGRTINPTQTSMPSLISYTVDTGEVAVQRKKRRLEYIKCESCRRDKQKCLPTDRRWPQRCNRCVERDLPCSEGDRAPGCHKSVRPAATGSLLDTSCVQEAADWAFLLTFRAMILPATNYLNSLEKDLSSFFSYDIHIWNECCSQYHQFEPFLKQLDSEISSCAIKLWALNQLPSLPFVTNTLVAEQLLKNCPARGSGVCPKSKGLPAMESLSAHDHAPHAFLVACRMLECHCSCKDCRQPSNYFKEMSNEFHKSAKQVLSARGLWEFLPHPARHYASFLPEVYTALPLTQKTSNKPDDIEDCFGRNALVRSVDYLDDETAFLRIHQVLVSDHATDHEEANERIRSAINYQDILGRSVLHVACQNGNAPLVKLLLERGALPNTRTTSGSMPLHLAAAAESLSICKILVQGYKQNVNPIDEFGRTPMFYTRKHDEVAQFLNLSTLNLIHELHMAIEQGDLANVRHTLSLGADPNSPYVVSSLSALEKANDRHDLPLLRILGDCPLTILDFPSHNSPTMLLDALERDFAEGVEYLIQRHDVDVNARNARGNTPLLHATLKGNTAIVKLLLTRNDVDVNARNLEGITPLMEAAWFPRTEIIDFLLARNDLDVNVTDNNLRTALMIAAAYGNGDIVDRLLKCDQVDVHVRGGRMQRTAVELAREGSHLETVLILETWAAQKGMEGSLNALQY
ncbi:hypothetical protein PMIN06_007862 [Paraphaeosphaeria minitans]